MCWTYVPVSSSPAQEGSIFNFNGEEPSATADLSWKFAHFWLLLGLAGSRMRWLSSRVSSSAFCRGDVTIWRGRCCTCRPEKTGRVLLGSGCLRISDKIATRKGMVHVREPFLWMSGLSLSMFETESHIDVAIVIFKGETGLTL